jgi:choline dehydrogenase-like flavoprotein
MPKQIYDVLIVGSGHSGGMAAGVLTQKGLRCLMLNAGPVADLEKDRAFKAAHELPYRGFGNPNVHLDHVFQANEFNANTWVNEKEVPYTHAPDAPFNWVRVRLVGGRSLFWARQSFRLSDFEFKAADYPGGAGENWPISHADLAPFYSRVEQQFRVIGRKEGWPQFPDGNFVASIDGTDSECQKRMTAVANKMGIPVSRMRAAMGEAGLASSVNLSLPAALATGKLDIVPNAVVREVTVDKTTGRANGVYFLDRHTRREMHASARVVVLAAGTLESTRLLLNSGIANSSGVVGHYLTDQLYGCTVIAAMPEARDGKANAALIGGGLFMPRFRNIDKNDKRNFRGGYCLPMSTGTTPDAKYFPEYGPALQKKLDSYAGACVQGGIYGEVLPRYENHVRINKEQKDAWGIPTLHIDARYGENEYNLCKDAADTMEELYKASGLEILVKSDKVNPPGYSIHELGTCRMGDDPKTSVLNKWNQSHDIKNLFVVDGSAFVTGGWQNPTMTILALSMRASEHLADELRQGNL